MSEITGMEASKTDFRGCATGATGQATLVARFSAPLAVKLNLLILVQTDFAAVKPKIDFRGLLQQAVVIFSK
ncbi:MAG: hypothetical protein II516_01500, partial [Treponema sp.]|nr:hypothetical protein [Treponema sp.]